MHATMMLDEVRQLLSQLWLGAMPAYSWSLTAGVIDVWRGDRHCHLRALLPVQMPINNRIPVEWLEMAVASVAHYQGGLAVNPEDGGVWLTRSVELDAGEPALVDAWLNLVEQRAVWLDQPTSRG
ncbi:hypothetical protein [Chitinivorax sp. B]|uniref:hypothetical protein n=1 Tax=Chitinivorax sp. B TaxID=2502235 RepID=UPI0010F7B064|nr:hypothetical protein [Chitinivorax sp. B]